MPRIETPRLYLRQWQRSDREDFIALNQNDRVMEFFPDTWPKERSIQFIETSQKMISDKNYGFWAVEERSTSRFIGFVGINDVPMEVPITQRHEIGWRLLPEFWRQGYATEAAQASVKYAFNTLQFAELVAFTAVQNRASRRVMEKLNMAVCSETFLHPKVSADSGLQEHVLYSLTRDAFGV